jgi:hypothetical protein
MHDIMGQQSQTVAHMHIDISGVDSDGEKWSNLADEQVPAEFGKNKVRGECVAGGIETVTGKNRAKGGCVANVNETATGKNRARGVCVAGETETATGGVVEKIGERKGCSVKRWKRQAQGTVAQEGHSQLQRMEKKKRKGVHEETDSVEPVGKKKTRWEADQMVWESNVQAEAAQQPRQAQ